MTNTHAAGWTSESPSPAQLSEFFSQVDSGRITKDTLQKVLNRKTPITLCDSVAVKGTTVFVPSTFFLKEGHSAFHKFEDESGGQGVVYLSVDFCHFFISKIEDNVPRKVVRCWQLYEDMRDQSIIRHIRNSGFKTEVSTIAGLLRIQPRREVRGILSVRPGKKNLFYADDKNGKTQVVRIEWLGDHWDIDVLPIGKNVREQGFSLVFSSSSK